MKIEVVLSNDWNQQHFRLSKTSVEGEYSPVDKKNQDSCDQIDSDPFQT